MLKKDLLHRVVAILTLICVVMGVMPAGSASADEKPGEPSISVKMVNDTDVEVTISKTKDADGFFVWVTSDYAGVAPGSYGQTGDVYEGYINAAEVKENGTAERKVTIKNLTKSEVSVMVTAYKLDFSGFKMCGKPSEAKTVTVNKVAQTGYKSSYDFSDAKKGDVIKFGSYEQDYPVDGKDAIEWVVLQKKKDSLMVMSKYALDSLPFNEEQEYITWNRSTIREWLNSVFYDAAFNETEKSMIRTTKVKNPPNIYAGNNGGKTIKNKVFLLSVTDAVNKKYGYKSDYEAIDKARKCQPTEYAKAQGLEEEFFNTKGSDGTVGTCDWWLLSAGLSLERAAYVHARGNVEYNGELIYREGGVRPVMCIKLKSE